MALFKSLDNLDDEKKQSPVDAEIEKVKCLIIGSGPAGYTAAIYAARANLNPVLYEGIEPGGQLTTTNDVENYPGYPEGVTGPVMMEDFKKQAERFGTDVRFGIATVADLSKRPFKVTIDDKKVIEAEVLIIATGATAKYLGLESETKFKGQGVSACATCDGFFYKGKDVAVVGGGDTAAEEATYLAGICNKVYLIIRKDHMRASKVMQERVFNTKNIEILFEHNTKEIVGDSSGVTGAVLVNGKGEEVKIDIHGFFLAIGHKPNSDIFKEYIDTDEVGYIKTRPDTSKTKVEGVFACGDVMDPHYRQAVTAAGSGCRAAIDAERFLAGQKK
ncbi:MAG: thioredoxin-disulfide reductase [Bacteroidales bacterium]|jgi:thioredoxin reductase (NADPH)|nr:thioredoxin-disulfide reductase [Bacteroidales bacterium]